MKLVVGSKKGKQCNESGFLLQVSERKRVGKKLKRKLNSMVVQQPFNPPLSGCFQGLWNIQGIFREPRNAVLVLIRQPRKSR